MSSEDLYVEFARQKADIAKLQSQVAALENILYKQKPKLSVTEVLADLASELSSKLLVVSEDEVRATEFFRNKEDWNTINKLLKQHGFKWVSAGKQSCWRRQG
jgi:phosphopantothenate synthetase